LVTRPARLRGRKNTGGEAALVGIHPVIDGEKVNKDAVHQRVLGSADGRGMVPSGGTKPTIGLGQGKWS